MFTYNSIHTGEMDFTKSTRNTTKTVVHKSTISKVPHLCFFSTAVLFMAKFVREAPALAKVRTPEFVKFGHIVPCVMLAIV